MNLTEAVEELRAAQAAYDLAMLRFIKRNPSTPCEALSAARRRRDLAIAAVLAA